MNLMQSEEEQFVISKFKRYGQPISKKSLERTIRWLRDKPSNSIDVLLKKLSQLALDSMKHEDNLQHAIEILSMKNKNLSSYDELIEEARKRSIYYISPYEYDDNTWFAERPYKELFEFAPEDKLKMGQIHFKRISEANKDNLKGAMLGVIYENYSSLTFEGKPKLMLQNEVNEVELGINSGFLSNSLLVSGCAYIVKGKQQGKDLTFTVSDFVLPNPAPEDKNPLLKQKFRQMCHNITSGKDQPGFSPADFTKYDCVHSIANQQNRPTLIYGNVTINQRTIKRLERLVSAFPQGVAALILMLSDEPQENIDFSIWLKCKVYLVPHISSEGPRLLPKLPLLKNRIPSAKILTNPARMCIQGKEVMLVNYPLIRNIYTNCLLSQQIVKLPTEEMTGKVAELIFSQGTVAIAQDIYWKQNQYFLINSETTVVVNDSVAAMGYQKSKGKGGLATTGNFQREGDFLCLVNKAKDFIQFCEEPQE